MSSPPRMPPEDYRVLPPYLPPVDDMEKLRLILPEIICIKKWLKDDESDRLRSLYDEVGNGDSVTHETFEAHPGGSLAIEVMDRLLGFVRDNCNEALVRDMGVMTRLTSTSHQSWAHADNCTWAPAHGGYIMNHTPLRTHTAMLYISDDCEGGELNVGIGPGPGGQLYSMDISCDKGTLVVLPSSEYFHHSVKNIKRGSRYAVITWYMRDIDEAMYGKPMQEVQKHLMRTRDTLWCNARR